MQLFEPLCYTMPARIHAVDNRENLPYFANSLKSIFSLEKEPAVSSPRLVKIFDVSQGHRTRFKPFKANAYVFSQWPASRPRIHLLSDDSNSYFRFKGQFFNALVNAFRRHLFIQCHASESYTYLDVFIVNIGVQRQSHDTSRFMPLFRTLRENGDAKHLHEIAVTWKTAEDYVECFKIATAPAALLQTSVHSSILANIPFLISKLFEIFQVDVESLQASFWRISDGRIFLLLLIFKFGSQINRFSKQFEICRRNVLYLQPSLIILSVHDFIQTIVLDQYEWYAPSPSEAVIQVPLLLRRVARILSVSFNPLGLDIVDFKPSTFALWLHKRVENISAVASLFLLKSSSPASMEFCLSIDDCSLYAKIADYLNIHRMLISGVVVQAKIVSHPLSIESSFCHKSTPERCANMTNGFGSSQPSPSLDFPPSGTGMFAEPSEISYVGQTMRTPSAYGFVPHQPSLKTSRLGQLSQDANLDQISVDPRRVYSQLSDPHLIASMPHTPTRMSPVSTRGSVNDFSDLRSVGALSVPNIQHSASLANLTNEIIPWRIENGLDSRTTCMLRNIPNKYTQRMLIEFIEETHKGTFDFVYLRMDFKNRCNVGYAFINFIEPKFVVSFAKITKGMKWTHFNTSKICDLTYANIQGRDALIRKFRNSRYLGNPFYLAFLCVSMGLIIPALC